MPDFSRDQVNAEKHKQESNDVVNPAVGSGDVELRNVVVNGHKHRKGNHQYNHNQKQYLQRGKFRMAFEKGYFYLLFHFNKNKD
jgi:UDP-2,3-diacylglucosamine pyrophosphatase LpxH